MQKAVFPIQSHADITKAINYMHTNYTQAINEGKPLRVVIDQKAEQRSVAQNRLFYMWMSELQRKTGQSEDSLKFFFKKKVPRKNLCSRHSGYG